MKGISHEIFKYLLLMYAKYLLLALDNVFFLELREMNKMSQYNFSPTKRILWPKKCS